MVSSSPNLSQMYDSVKPIVHSSYALNYGKMEYVSVVYNVSANLKLIIAVS